MNPDNDNKELFGLEVGEVGLLLFLILTSIYFFIQSFEYPAVTGFFPRLTSGIVIIGCVLLLFRTYLPENFEDWLAGSAMQAEFEEELDLPDVEHEQPQEQELEETTDYKEYSIGSWNLSITAAGEKQIGLVVLLVGYIVLSFLIGMLWATPIFMLVYTVWSELPWYLIVTLPPFAFGIAWVFTFLLNLPTRSGYLIELLVGGL